MKGKIKESIELIRKENKRRLDKLAVEIIKKKWPDLNIYADITDLSKFLIVDIGSNNNIFPSKFEEYGFTVLKYITFWGKSTAELIKKEWGRADIITAFNILAFEDSNDFAEGVNTLLKDDGLLAMGTFSLDMIKLYTRKKIE